MSLIRILVVDDFEPWRRFVLSMLKQNPELQVVCESSDGLEAVQRAEELQPDLILLDVGLPRLNGIEAARRIRQIAPHSRILFVSQESSPEVAKEGLRLGAWGYVIKSHAGGELLAAVEAVIRGEQFVSASLGGEVFSAIEDEHALSRLRREEVLHQVPPLPRKSETSRSHHVEFYADDECFLDSFTRAIGSALKAGNAVIVVATESHRDSLLQRLQAHGLACGECAPTLLAEGKADAAIRLEQLWDEMAKSYDVDILCGYPLGSFHRIPHSQAFQRICAEHSAVYSR